MVMLMTIPMKCSIACYDISLINMKEIKKGIRF